MSENQDFSSYLASMGKQQQNNKGMIGGLWESKNLFLNNRGVIGRDPNSEFTINQYELRGLTMRNSDGESLLVVPTNKGVLYIQGEGSHLKMAVGADKTGISRRSEGVFSKMEEFKFDFNGAKFESENSIMNFDMMPQLTKGSAVSIAKGSLISKPKQEISKNSKNVSKMEEEEEEEESEKEEESGKKGKKKKSNKQTMSTLIKENRKDLKSWVKESFGEQTIPKATLFIELYKNKKYDSFEEWQKNMEKSSEAKKVEFIAFPEGKKSELWQLSKDFTKKSREDAKEYSEKQIKRFQEFKEKNLETKEDDSEQIKDLKLQLKKKAIKGIEIVMGKMPIFSTNGEVIRIFMDLKLRDSQVKKEFLIVNCGKSGYENLTILKPKWLGEKAKSIALDTPKALFKEIFLIAGIKLEGTVSKKSGNKMTLNPELETSVIKELWVPTCQKSKENEKQSMVNVEEIISKSLCAPWLIEPKKEKKEKNKRKGTEKKTVKKNKKKEEVEKNKNEGKEEVEEKNEISEEEASDSDSDSSSSSESEEEEEKPENKKAKKTNESEKKTTTTTSGKTVSKTNSSNQKPFKTPLKK
jgi:hypothetical protein